MNKKSDIIFLTRGEILIFSEYYLSIHLKPGDVRQKVLSDLVSQNRLKILTIDPTTNFSKFELKKWYLIQHLVYIESYDHSGYTHFKFRYRFANRNYVWEIGEGTREIKSEEEIKKLRKLNI